MNLSMSKKLLVALVVVGGAWGVLSAPMILAQKAETKSESKADAKAPTAKKASKRLPNFYGDLVDGAQKEKIYVVLDKYNPQIEALAEQIKALQAKRDAEVEGVLNPEQKAKLDKSRADSKAKAQERAAAKKAASEPAPTATVTKPAAAATPTTTTKATK